MGFVYGDVPIVIPTALQMDVGNAAGRKQKTRPEPGFHRQAAQLLRLGAAELRQWMPCRSRNCVGCVPK